MNDNKLIAEFMGYEILYRPNSNGFIELSETELCDVDDLMYHTSWSELMPVIRKCKNVDADWINDNAQHLIDDIDNALTCCWSEKSTCKAVVEFIKEFNLKAHTND